jgi:hypothetical protein
MGPRLGVLSEPASVYIGNPLLAFIVAVLAVGLLVWLLAYWLRDKLNKPGDQGSEGSRWEWLIGFIRGLDGEPSLSLFQIGIWTLLVLVGMVYVFLMSGDLLDISEQVLVLLVLLGLAGLGSLSARFASAGAGAPPTATGFWGMFVVGGKPDLLRLQLFLFTVAIWVYVAARVFYEQEFAELDTEVLLLMGISNGVYVGAKWVAAGDASRLSAAGLELRSLATAERQAMD